MEINQPAPDFSLPDLNGKIHHLSEYRGKIVIDRDGILRYRGAVDDVTFRKRTPSRFYLDEAVEALLAGRFPETTDSPAYGCTIVREV